MQNLVIRNAKPEEVEIIQNLNNQLINYEMEQGFDSYVKDWALSEVSKEYFLHLIKNELVIVAELDGHIVGYLAGSIYKDESFSYYEGLTAELNNMFVLDGYRSYGIGSKLVNSFMGWCNKNKAGGKRNVNF